MPVKGDNLGQLTALTTMDHHGGDSVYTAPGGSPIPTRATVNKNVEISTGEAYVTERVTAVDLFVADVGTPERGAIIVTGIDTYSVQKIIDDDGFIVSVAVRKM